MEQICPLHEAARKYETEVAVLTESGLKITYGELNTFVNCAREALEQKGFGRGDRVGLYMKNSLEQVVLILALFRLQAVVCPLSPKLPVTVAASYLELIGGAGLVSDSDADTGEIAVPEKIYHVTDINLQKPGELFEATDPTVLAEGMATVIFTSGSSGIPKAVVHSISNHMSSAFGANFNIPLGLDDRYLLSLPLCHIAGLSVVFRCLASGATLVVADKEENMLETLKKYRITHVSMVAAQLFQLLQVIGTEKLALKAILLGGSSIPSSLVQRAITTGLPVYLSYGSSETASQVVATGRLTAEDDFAVSGKVLLEREVKISDLGEILVRGKTLFQGYLQGGELRKPFDKDGWFATGDLGRFDKHGNLFVLGRRDNMFISGGENIYPEEVEKVLCEQKEIQQALVVSVPDAKFGQKAVAFLRVGSEKLDYKILREKLLQQLPRYKVPRHFLDWPEEGANQKEIKVDRNYFMILAREAFEGDRLE